MARMVEKKWKKNKKQCFFLSREILDVRLDYHCILNFCMERKSPGNELR